jgi:hypothetical protein
MWNHVIVTIEGKGTKVLDSKSENKKMLAAKEK